MRDQLNDMQLYLVEEYVEDFQEGLLTRREALRRIAAISGSLAFATALLAACGPTEEAATPTTAGAASSSPTATVGGSPTTAAGSPTPVPGSPAAAAGSPTTAASNPTPGAGVTVPENDPDISAGPVEFPGEGATLLGYMARPAGEGTFPIILVCHENRGLTPHIQDVTRRLAKAGYLGLAVDLLSREGGTAKLNSDDIPAALGNVPEGQPVQDFQSALRFAAGQPFAAAEQVGMVGFCYGGGVTWRVATRTPELRAAVPFYGPAPRVEDVPGIQAVVLAIYAEQDQRINAGIPEIEAAMAQHGKTFEKVIFPGVNHAFHNDTGPRYDQAAATEAWARTLAWFEQYVRG